MLIKLRNGQVLNLPEDIIDTVTLGTDKQYLHSGTSYVANLVRQMQKTKGKYLLYKPHLACLYNIAEHLAGEYSSYFEPFGGVGVTAKIFNAPQTWVNDYDPLCVRVLWKNFQPFRVTQVDMTDAARRKALYQKRQDVDIVHLDYNNYTLHKFATDKPVFGKGVGYREMTAEAFACAGKFVIINDCTPTLLTKGRLNAHSLNDPPFSGFAHVSRDLGQRVSTREEFFSALVPYYASVFPAWHLTCVEHFRESSYLLFRKNGPRPLTIHRHNAEELHLNPVAEMIDEVPAV
jgi:hypothetical protein